MRWTPIKSNYHHETFKHCLQTLHSLEKPHTLSHFPHLRSLVWCCRPLECRLLQPAQSFRPNEQHFLVHLFCHPGSPMHALDTVQSHTVPCAFDCAQHNASRTFERSLKAPFFELPLIHKDPPKVLWLPIADISYSFSMLHSSWALHFLKPSPCLRLLKQSVVWKLPSACSIIG